jgi:thiaminase
LSKAPDRKSSAFIADLIKGTDEEIETVHMKYFKKFGVTERELSDSAPNPGTKLYNSYLVKTATLEPFQVGLIAALPCNWIYYQVGVDMKKKGQAGGNKYQEWIDAYGSEPWEKSDAKAFVDLVEYYLKNATPAERKKMRQAYETAMKFEYMFWDEVYRQSI